MCNINQSLNIAKDCGDLVYFVEDDYLHKLDAIEEMVFAYERISTQLGNELISGSSQIATEISGAFTDASSSLASRVSTNEGYLNQSVKTDATPTFAGLTSTSEISESIHSSSSTEDSVADESSSEDDREAEIFKPPPKVRKSQKAPKPTSRFF